MSILFAATYPERTASMIVYGSSPSFRTLTDFLPAERDRFERRWQMMESLVEDWGDGGSIEFFAPRRAHDEAARRSWALLERVAVSPAMAQSLLQSLLKIDVTSVLPAIRVPTLVLHRSGDPAAPVEAAHYTAERIPDARLVELPGDDHVPFFGDADALLDEVEQFLTGFRQSREPDRVLATVVFTDIVGSTQRASELGDRRWRELLEAYDDRTCRQVEGHGGRVVKGLGDGHLATFDGPARAIRRAPVLAHLGARRLGMRPNRS